MSRFRGQDLHTIAQAAQSWLESNNILPSPAATPPAELPPEPVSSSSSAPIAPPPAPLQQASSSSWSLNRKRGNHVGSTSMEQEGVALVEALKRGYTIHFSCLDTPSDHFGANAVSGQILDTPGKAEQKIRTEAHRFSKGTDGYELQVQRRKQGIESIKLKVESQMKRIKVYHCGFSQGTY